MFAGRRTLILLLALAVIGAPATLMRALCIGRSCDAPAAASSSGPFCRLPATIRRELLAGYQEGRSPDVFAIARTEGAVDVGGPPWPGIDRHVTRLPFVMSITGDPAIDGGIDQIAPTIASIMGLDRPHPEVRSGTALPLTDPIGERPRAVLLIGIKGWGAPDRPPPSLETAVAEGLRTEISARSTPADPAALFTTIGTGGLPRQHGITGSFIRDPAGRLTRAWEAGAPTSVIATLADDLDELAAQNAEVAMVAHDPTDRGLIGDGWYIGADRDRFVVEPDPGRAGREFARVVRAVDAPSLYALTVDLAEGERPVDRAIGDAIAAVQRVAAGKVLTVAVGTGAGTEPAITETELMDELGDAGGLIERTVAGGFFVDQARLARTGTSEDALVDALKNVEVEGRPLFGDVFTGISLAFGRYC
jgi:hypothetical protein